MAQQTAVEWLFEKMAQTPMTNWYEVREQALAMEKEQIIDAFEHGHTNGVDKLFCMDNPMLKNSEQYYNEKYNNIDDAH